MIRREQVEERFQEYGEPAAYRPVSMLAVAGLVVGMASSLALATPMLWTLPLVGVGVAVAALTDVAKAGAEKAGRFLALAGLALSVGFGVQAVTSAVVSRSIVEGRARSVASIWLDAIRDGRLADARSMVGSDVLGTSSEMPPHPGHVEEPPDPAELDAKFLEVPAVVAIGTCGPAAEREVRCTGPDATAGVWGVNVRLAPCAEGRRSVEIALRIAPSTIEESGGSLERWVIIQADVLP